MVCPLTLTLKTSASFPLVPGQSSIPAQRYPTPFSHVVYMKYGHIRAAPTHFPEKKNVNVSPSHAVLLTFLFCVCYALGVDCFQPWHVDFQVLLVLINLQPFACQPSLLLPHFIVGCLLHFTLFTVLVLLISGWPASLQICFCTTSANSFHLVVVGLLQIPFPHVCNKI